MDEVGDWLVSKLRLPTSYRDNFKQASVDGLLLTKLTFSELEELTRPVLFNKFHVRKIYAHMEEYLIRDGLVSILSQHLCFLLGRGVHFVQFISNTLRGFRPSPMHKQHFQFLWTQFDN